MAKKHKSEFSVGVVRLHNEHWDFINGARPEGHLSDFIGDAVLAHAEKVSGKKRPDAPRPHRGPVSQAGELATQLGLTRAQFKRYATACVIAESLGNAKPKPADFAK